MYKKFLLVLLSFLMIVSSSLCVFADDDETVNANQETESLEVEKETGGALDSSDIDTSPIKETDNLDDSYSFEEESTYESLSDSDIDYKFTGGYIESEEDYNTPVYEPEFELYANEDLTSYIPDLSKYPDSRNQNPYGTCWAFTSIGLAEFDLINDGYTDKNIDLSELQLAYFTYNFVTDPLGGTAGDTSSYNKTENYGYLNKGGNLMYSSRRLMQWISPTSEESVPYSNAASTVTDGLGSSYAYNKTNYHLSNVYLINIKENTNELKQQILQHGAAGVAYYHNENNYTKKTDAEYYSFYDKGINYTNHAVMIVGWDDNYSVDNFSGENKPTSNGAWLIRNSWGSYVNYFWMSYETSSLTDTAYIFDFSENDGLDNNYQLDGGINAGYTTATHVANVFEVSAKDNVDYELLTNVSLSLTHSANVEYTIEIYTGLTDDSNPLSGAKQENATTTGKTTFAGVHTIELNNPVKLSPGTKFSVVVSINDGAYMDIEYAESGDAYLSSSVSGGTNKSFYKNYAGYTAYNERNFCIKAYTSNIKENTITYDVDVEGNPTKISSLDGEVTLKEPTKIGYTFLGWYDGDNKVTTVSAGKDYNLKAKWQVNTYTITYNNMEGASNVGTNPSSVTYEDGAKTLANPTKNGYEFKGWYTDGEFKNEVSEIPAHLTSNYTIYAKWEKIIYTYTITYNNVDGASNQNPTEIKSDDLARILEDAKKDGYKFDGWYLDESFTNKITQIPANPDQGYVLYAKWTKIFKVTYKYAGDEEYGTPTNISGTLPQDGEYNEGTKVSAPSALSSSDKNTSDGTRGAWSFVWSVSEDFEISKDTTITGTWTFTPADKSGKAGYFLVADDAKWENDTLPDGVNDSSDQKYYIKNKLSQGDTFTVTSSKPVREGFVFVGWFDKERTVDKNVVSQAQIRLAGSDVTYVYKDKDYCLDALWAKLDVSGYEGSYDGVNHTISDTLMIDYGNDEWKEKYGETALSKITVEKTEYSTSTVNNGTYSETKPTFKDAGTYTVKVRMLVKVGDNETTLEKEATVKINPVKLTITTGSNERAYNGDPLTAEGSISGFVNNEDNMVNFTVTGKQVNVGQSVNTYNIDWNDVNKANYTIDENLGTLKVTEALGLTVIAADASKVYDGTGLSSTASATITRASDASLVSFEDDGIIIRYSSQKEDGSWSNYSLDAPVIYDVQTLNVKVRATKANYKAAEATYKLTITQRPVTFKGKSDSKTYTGKELKVEGFETYSNSNPGGLLEGSTTNVEASASGTNAGTYNGTITPSNKVVIKDKDGKDVSKNYSITTLPGELVINKANNLDLNVENLVKDYDGNTYSKEATSNVAGTTITYKYGDLTEYTSVAPTITNAGTTKVSAKASNPNYEDVYKEYTLTINPRKVTFTGETATKTYTGSEIVLNGVTPSNLLSGHTYNVSATSKGTSVGEYTGSITAKENVVIKDVSGNVVTDNYDITTIPGKLIISARPVVDININAGDKEKTYDGVTLSLGASSSTDGAIIEYSIDNGASFSSKLPSITDFGELKVIARASKEGCESATTTYTLKIKQRPVSFIGESDNKTYNGEKFELTKVSFSGLVDGHTYNVKALASGIDAATYDGTITAKDDVVIWDKDGRNVTGNYIITTTPGKLTINPLNVKVDIVGKSLSTTYSGKTQSLSGYSVTYDNSLYSEKYIGYSGSNGVSGVNAGKYDLILNRNDFTNKNNNFNVTFNVTNGLLTINKAKLIVTTLSASKTYDGSALTAAGEVKGFVNDESATFKTTGSQLNVGSSKNTYLLDFNGASANKDNYEIEEHLGTLTINKDTKSEDKKNDIDDVKVVTCKEAMGSSEWTWSESKKACVYKVSNTSSK